MAFLITILCFISSIVVTSKAIDNRIDGDDFHSPFSEHLEDIDVRPDLPYKTFTKDELSKYNGKDADLPIYVAVKGVVFDVSKGKDFYGPGQKYNVFAGKDASRAIAKWSMKEDDLNDNLDDLSEDQLGTLDQVFESLYVARYPTVGYLKGHEPPLEDNHTHKPKHREL